MTSDKPIHKGGHLNKYLTNTPWYLLSSLMTKGMGFFLLPLFTHYLSAEEYGTLSTLESFGRVIPIFLSLYLDAAFSRYYYQERELSEKKVTTLFSTHFWFLLPWGVGICIISIVMSPFLISDIISVSILPIIVLVFTQLLNQLAIMVTMIWTANLLAKKLAVLQMTMSFLALLLTVYFLVVEGDGWESRIYSLGIVALIQVVFLIYIACRNSWLKLEFDYVVLKRSLRFSVPLIPNIAAGWITMFSDRIILAHFDRIEEVGLYSIAAQIATLMYIINDAMTKIQGSVAMSGLTTDHERAKRKIAQFILAYFSLMSLAYFFLISFSKELLHFFTDPGFHGALFIIPIISLVYLFSGFYRVFSIVISYHNATWVISAAAFVQAIVNIILNFLFIPIFGMYGAAVSSVTSLIFYTLFIFYFSQKIDYIEVNYGELSKIFCLLILFSLLGVWLNYNYDVGIIVFVLKLILFILMLIMILCLKSNEQFRCKVNDYFCRLRRKC
ncbi:oligosaccharide flippase family protein [Vibrio sp. E150_011]